MKKAFFYLLFFLLLTAPAIGLAQCPPANPGFGSNVWNVSVWNAGNATGDAGAWTTNFAGYYVISSLSFDTRLGQTYSTAQSWNEGTQGPGNAAGYIGCAVGADNHSYAFKRQGFPCSNYRINIPTHDDESRLFINGVMVWQHDNGCCDAHASIWTGYLGPNTQLEYRVSEGGGGSHGSLEFVDLGAPANPGFGNNTWNVLAYQGGNIALSGSYMGYYTEPLLSYNTVNRWGSGASPSDASGYIGCAVTADNHVVVSKRTNFSCGYYQLNVPSHDDDIRVYIDGALVWSHEPGCCDPHTNIWTGWLQSSSTVEVRHLEGGGGSNQELTFTNVGSPPGFGNATWNVVGYNGGNINLTGTYSGYYTENNLTYNSTNRWGSLGSPSDATGWQGCVIPVDNHAVVSKRTNFPCRKYQINVDSHDDDARLYVNGAGSPNWSHEPGCCDAHTNVWTGYLSTGSTLEFRHLEGGGGSYQGLTVADITPAIVNGNMTVNGTAGNISVCESNSILTIAQNGGSFPEANYFYWIGYDNGSGWVNSWDLMNQGNQNISSFSYALPGPGNYVIHTNAQNATCGSAFQGAGVTRLVTVSAIAPSYSVDYSSTAAAQALTIPGSSGATPSLGTTSGANIAFTSNVPSGGGALPLCTNWGLPKTLKIIDANHTGPCIVPLADADAILTFDASNGNTNLSQGNLCFTGATNFVGAVTCAVRLRVQVRLTSNLSTGYIPCQMVNSGNYIMARVNNNVSVLAWLEVQAPGSGLTYFSGTAGGVAIAAGSSWHAALPFFDNILNKGASSNLCSSFYYDWKGAGENGVPFGGGFFKITGITPTASANPNPYCTTAPAQTALALTGGTGTASGSCTLTHEWRSSATTPPSYSGSAVSAVQSPTGLAMAANTYNYVLSGPSNVCYGIASVVVSQNTGTVTTWGLAPPSPGVATNTATNDSWYTHSNWDHCVPDNTIDAVINDMPNYPKINTSGAKAKTLKINTPGGANKQVKIDPACTPWPCLSVHP